MKAHKHAEKMMQYAQDALQSETPWKLWEFKHTADTRWVACELNPVWQERDEYRRKLLKQVIDWTQKAEEVPALAISESGAVAFLTLDLDAVGPSLYLSLETGLWVFNHNGTNPWPEGVLVYYKLRDAAIATKIRVADLEQQLAASQLQNSKGVQWYRGAKTTQKAAHGELKALERPLSMTPRQLAKEIAQGHNYSIGHHPPARCRWRGS